MIVSKTVTVDSKELELLLDLSDEWSQRAIYERGIWEPPIVELLLKHLKPGMTFIDIGAAIGWFTLIAAYCVGEKGRVLSFEPVSTRFELLSKNIQSNGYENISAHKLAVSDRDDVAFIGGPFNPMFLTYDDTQYQVNVPTQTVSLDSLYGGHHIDMVKIDVEGAELRVLNGMVKIIADSRPLIICEVHKDFLTKHGDSIDQLDDFLNSMGYSKRSLWNHWICEPKDGTLHSS